MVRRDLSENRPRAPLSPGSGSKRLSGESTGFGSRTGGIPGQTYTPPSLKDGRIEPGHLD